MLDGRKHEIFLGMQHHFLIYNRDIVMLDGRKHEIFLEMQHHFLIYNRDTVTLDGRKHEIFLEMQHHNGMIFTNDKTVFLLCSLPPYRLNSERPRSPSWPPTTFSLSRCVPEGLLRSFCTLNSIKLPTRLLL